MKRRFFHYRVLTATVFVAAGLMITGTLEAQNYASGTTSVSTPRTPDGKPDLSGMWVDTHAMVLGTSAAKGNVEKKLENGDAFERFASRRCAPTQKGTEGKGCFEETNETADGEFNNRFDPNGNRPVYKPEYWDKVQQLDYNTNTKDPQWTCMPLGVPRMGFPTQIIQTPKYVLFFYAGAPTTSFRIIPIDGRGHDPVRAKDISYFGDPAARWEGDTLVVESVGFNDETWFARGGLFHSYDLKVTERFRRDGNHLHYQATVEDPTVLLQPWVMNPKELDLNTDPAAYVHEGDQCQSTYDPGIAVSRVRH